MGAGTVLFVRTMLLNGINDNLPKTSYMKLLDLWFVWHILNIFAVITYHIAIDRMHRYFVKLDEDSTSKLFCALDDETSVNVRNATTKINRINQISLIVFPFLNDIFYGIYFNCTLN